MTDPHEQNINGLKFLMLPVKGGTFRMGSKQDDKEAYGREKPDHDVLVSDFYLGQYPVTQDLWLEIMGENPSFFSGERRSVENVSWLDIVEGDPATQKRAFLDILNEKTGRKYRLPTEAEWEFAARGGCITNSYKYSGSDKLKEVGWFSDNSHGETKPVGMKASNELGFYDMSGNVWEWVEDWNADEYYKECAAKGMVENPRGPKKGSHRVARGGGWGLIAQICRSACRSFWLPDDRGSNIGFRLALALQ